MRRAMMVIMVASVSLMGGTAAAGQEQARAAASARQLDRLLACRQVVDQTARLACFDRESSATAEGLANRNLVVIDREAVRSTKRSLFGLSLPSLGVFDDDKDNEVTQLEGVVEAVSRNRDGGWVFFLEGGARWSQIDSRPIALEPQKGSKVVIRKAALGSYMLSVDRQPGIRVRRIN